MKIKSLSFGLLMLAGSLGMQAAAQTAHPLDGRIWDTRSKSFVTADAVYDQAASSNHVLLGEKHDSEIHHQLQLQALQALDARGVRPTLALEQFDSEHQAALTAAQKTGTSDAEKLADAGQLNRKGWRWPMYKDLIGYAAEKNWPLAAANLSRAEGRDIAMGKIVPQLPAADVAQIAAMEDEIVQGHCGQRPPQDRLAAIVNAQRARDQRMAEALAASKAPTVLIAGAGHVRRDRAVPRYLKDGDKALAIAYVETREGKTSPDDYDAAGFDLLWFTAATPRGNPCAQPIAGSVAAPSSQSKEK